MLFLSTYDFNSIYNEFACSFTLPVSFPLVSFSQPKEFNATFLNIGKNSSAGAPALKIPI